MNGNRVRLSGAPLALFESIQSEGVCLTLTDENDIASAANIGLSEGRQRW